MIAVTLIVTTNLITNLIVAVCSSHRQWIENDNEITIESQR